MVRLKAFWFQIQVVPRNLFQFHYGTIKSNGKEE